MFKKGKVFIVSIIASMVIMNFSPQIQANDCPAYSLFWFYDGWSYEGTPGIDIYYTYTREGIYNYSTRVSNAVQEWENKFSPFNFHEVSRDPGVHNYVTIVSNNYGDTGWVGRAYYRENPRRIQINEWYQRNLEHYNWTAYERTIIHELGHTHGLDHVSCVSEIMSNNPNRNIYQVTLGRGDIQGVNHKY